MEFSHGPLEAVSPVLGVSDVAKAIDFYEGLAFLQRLPGQSARPGSRHVRDPDRNGLQFYRSL